MLLIFCSLTRAGPLETEQLVIDKKMQATLWVQTALEYQVSCVQAFRLAESKLRVGLANPQWSAAVEQGIAFARKPPAVILDVDETVLDNSPFNARMVKANKSFDREEFERWCKEEKAHAIPGAKEFIRSAMRSGVDVYFVTNRDKKLKACTASNLAKALGIPINSHRLLLKNERESWTSDKSSRRALIAKTHRILLLIGDDFNDFVKLKETTPMQRNVAGEHFRPSWGQHWILLPNPIYGSWEKSLYGYNSDRSEAEFLRIRHDSLRTER